MRFIIIGGGGFGLELYTYLLDDIATGALPGHCTIAVLDETDNGELMTRNPDATYLGRVAEYDAADGDQALIAIGSVVGRRKVFKIAQERNIPLGRYIHPSAWVAPNASLGKGVILCPNSMVSACASVADNVAINVYAGVGHGATVGAHSVMGPYSVINGDTSLGEGCYLGSRATLFPKVSLGKGCTVDAHSAVKASTGDFKIISVKGQYLELANRLAERNFN